MEENQMNVLLEAIRKIVREEMENVNAGELLMPALIN